MEKTINFWIWRHTWQENGSEEESIEFVNNAYKNNYVCMQYEYGIQKQRRVTTSYNKIRKEMKEGDYIFLGGKDYVYAYSKICKPRKVSTKPLCKLSAIPKGKKWIYNSKKSNDVIRFEDAPVLYFDFSETDKTWGQRIDVEGWRCFVEDGIYSKNIKTKSSPYIPMREISKADGQRLIEEFRGSVKMETAKMDKLKSILSIKKNIILQGAPGTGKTYNTAALALNIIGEDITGLKHSEIMTKYNEYIKSGQIMFTTFHQSMDYEDFVEGLKPEIVQDSEGKQVGVNYIIKPGMFKNICTKAKQKEGVNIIECIDKYLHSVKGYENRKTIPTISNKSSLYVWWEEGNKTISTRSTLSTSEKDEKYSPSPLNIEKVKAQAIGEGEENNWHSYAQAFINAVIKEYKVEDDKSDKPFVLIIDEINRGNVSKIFGELITLLEADKRTNGDHPITVTLPYSKDSFSVPSNLYIIGTMNTTDRSTGTLDYALRRRFAFVTLKSDREAIENYYNDKPQAPKDKALKLFDTVYELLSIKEYKTDMNIEDLMVGHSYFMAKTEDDLRMKLDYEIKPLLLEYAKDGIISINEDKLVEIMNTWTI